MRKLLILLSVMLLAGVLIASTIEWKSDLIFSHKYHYVEVEAECTPVMKRL